MVYQPKFKIDPQTQVEADVMDFLRENTVVPEGFMIDDVKRMSGNNFSADQIIERLVENNPTAFNVDVRPIDPNTGLPMGVIPAPPPGAGYDRPPYREPTEEPIPAIKPNEKADDLYGMAMEYINSLTKGTAEARTRGAEAIKAGAEERWGDVQSMLKSEALKQTRGMGRGAMDTGGYLTSLAKAKTKQDTSVLGLLSELDRYYTGLETSAKGTALSGALSLYGTEKAAEQFGLSLDWQKEMFGKEMGFKESELGARKTQWEKEMDLMRERLGISTEQWEKEFAWSKEFPYVQRKWATEDWDKYAELSKELAEMSKPEAQDYFMEFLGKGIETLPWMLKLGVI